jgi:DNA-binding CsgD family transcriptional regulator/PAS domain-containing protein
MGVQAMQSAGQGELATFSELLESVYESATDPGHWRVFLEGLARTLNAKSGMFRVIDERGPTIRASAHYNLDPDLQRAHREYFVQQDPYLRELRDKPAGFIVPGEAFVDHRGLRRTEFFADYMAPQDTHHVCGGLAMRTDEFTIKFGLQRDRATGPFSGREADYIRRFVPHIQRAARLGHLLDLAGQQHTTAERALESLGVGLVLIDHDQRVVYANAKAESTFAWRCGVTQSGGRLVSVHAEDDTRLRHLLGVVLARARQATPPVPEATLLSPSAGQPHMLVVASPVPAGQSVFHGPWSRPGAAVFISNLQDAGLLDHEVLVMLYGLTETEAQLACALSRGHELAGLSQEWGVSRETLRTHLKRALQKTGVRRQADLVRLLVGAPWKLVEGRGADATTEPTA